MSGETHASRAYAHLREKLIAGELEPGTRLLYGPIGREIGVSATPVREAAGRLANEGLVDLVPQRGAIVRTIDREELIEIYEVRLAIEPYAAKLAAKRAADDHLSRLDRACSRMEEVARSLAESSGRFAGKRLTSRFDAADYDFHLTIIEATGNRAMVRTAGQSHVLTRVFGVRRHRYTAESVRDTCEEHRAVLDAIRAGRSAAAESAAARHIRHGLQLSLDAIEQADG